MTIIRRTASAGFMASENSNHCSRMQNRMPQPQGAEWADEKFITRNFGLTHTPIYNLRKAGLIRSISTAGPGQKYGKRLFHVGSIREWIAAQESREVAK